MSLVLLRVVEAPALEVPPAHDVVLHETVDDTVAVLPVREGITDAVETREVTPQAGGGGALGAAEVPHPEPQSPWSLRTPQQACLHKTLV